METAIKAWNGQHTSIDFRGAGLIDIPAGSREYGCRAGSSRFRDRLNTTNRRAAYRC